MSKTAVKKLHWRSKVQDSFVPLLGSSGELGIAIGGGADYGEFPFVTSAPGGGLTVGDIILEIGGTPVLDTRGKVNSLLDRSSCLATEKTLLSHLFKSSHIPVSTRAHVDRADPAEAAHITFSLVLTSRFFMNPLLVVNTTLTSSKARNSFSFLTLQPRVPAFL